MLYVSCVLNQFLDRSLEIILFRALFVVLGVLGQLSWSVVVSPSLNNILNISGFLGPPHRFAVGVIRHPLQPPIDIMQI